MGKVVGLVLMVVFVLGVSSCTRQSESPTNVPSATASTTPTPRATATTPSPTPTSTAPTTASVKGSNFKWVDDASGTAITTIKVGGKVTWTAEGTHSLQRVAPSAANGCDELEASFDSEEINQPVTRTFNKVGTFGYHCGIHGGTPNCKNPPGGTPGRMPGVIKVVP